MRKLSHHYSKTAAVRMCLCASLLMFFVVTSRESHARPTLETAGRTVITDQSLAGSPTVFAVGGNAGAKLEIAAAQKFGEGLSKSKWVEYLGPMAPVALSPFFGIACLSGMALYGSGQVSPDNPFLGEGSALANPVLFWVFVFLTILTSLPRLTKVSKPFAQAMDQVETWAGIITLLVLKVMSGAEPDVAPEALVLQAGIFSASAETLLMVASVINIVVINMVKFFFEVLIWITPVPFLDAIFEVANKSLCAGLMGVYAYSPTVATIINLIMFVACLFVFSWVKRREVYFRRIMIDPILALVFPSKGMPNDGRVIVFPKKAFGPFQTRAKCILEPTDTGWKLTQRRLLRSAIVHEIDRTNVQAAVQPGFFTNSIQFNGEPTASLSFSQRYRNHMPDLADQLKMGLNKPTPAPSRQPTPGLA